MTDSRKLAVEKLVDEHGLDTAEARIKDLTGQYEGERYELLGHARKFAGVKEAV